MPISSGQNRANPASIAVVIPTYNGEKFIDAAIESVYAQSRPPEQLIVVDDHSSDGTPGRVRRLLDRPGIRTRLIELPVNSGGPAKPINVGIAETSADFVCVLDQDDVLAPQRLARDGDILRADEAIAVTVWWCGLFGSPDERTLQSDRQKAQILASGVERDGLRILPSSVAIGLLLTLRNFALGYPGMTFRRDIWATKGGVDETLLIASDMELMGHLFARGQTAVVPEIGYFRRIHGANATRRRARTNYEIVEVCSRLVADDPALRDSPVAAALRSEAKTLVYWFRAAGLTHEALALCGCLSRLNEHRFVIASEWLKTWALALFRPILRRPIRETGFTQAD